MTQKMVSLSYLRSSLVPTRMIGTHDYLESHCNERKNISSKYYPPSALKITTHNNSTHFERRHLLRSGQHNHKGVYFMDQLKYFPA